MKVKNYKHIHTGEIVADEDANLYALEKLGIKVIPRKGVLTSEQIEFIDYVKDWYFSGNWIVEWEDID